MANEGASWQTRVPHGKRGCLVANEGGLPRRDRLIFSGQNILGQKMLNLNQDVLQIIGGIDPGVAMRMALVCKAWRCSIENGTGKSLCDSKSTIST